MGDLQAQLEEVKHRWEEETLLRSHAEAESETLNQRSTDDKKGTSKSQATIATPNISFSIFF